MSTARLPIGTRLRNTRRGTCVVIVGDDMDRYHVAVEGTAGPRRDLGVNDSEIFPMDDIDPLRFGWTIVPSPDSHPASDGWRRGARVIRRGQRGVVTHFHAQHGTDLVLSWVVVADEPAGDDGDGRIGVSFSSGENGHPSDAGWALDVTP